MNAAQKIRKLLTNGLLLMCGKVLVMKISARLSSHAIIEMINMKFFIIMIMKDMLY